MDDERAGVRSTLMRVMGTSVPMIKRHDGALLDGAHAGIAGRLESDPCQVLR
jgi:hypothetical protein